MTTDSKIETHIRDTESRLEEARGRYNLLVTQVADDKDRQRKVAEQPSFDIELKKTEVVHQTSSSSNEIRARFVTIQELGAGSYGQVYEVRERSTGASYARKHIRLDAGKSPNMIAEEVVNEVNVMQKLRHLHIASVLFYLKEEETYSIFMLPVADWDLGKFLRSCDHDDFPISKTKNIYPWFGCILDALAYAHKLKIKHQDIKPSNILIKDDQPFLCDFGLAKDFADVDTSKSRGPTVVGSRHYHAPEVKPKLDRGRKADVFALGCVFSEMLTVCKGKSIEDYREARLDAGSMYFRECLDMVNEWVDGLGGKGKPQVQHQGGDRLHDLLVAVIKGMLEEDKDDRYTSEKALNYLKSERALFCVE